MKQPFDERRIRSALMTAWSLQSAKQWTPQCPAAGQCNVTATLIFDLFGGEILRTGLHQGYHYYNRIGGKIVDLTDSQFAEPIAYQNETSSRAAAMESVHEDEYGALRTRLEKLLSP